MALPSKNSFVASMFVMAACVLMAGGMALVENIEYWRYAQPATMSLSDPAQKVVRYEDDTSSTRRDVVLMSDAGAIDMPGRLVPKTVAERMDAGHGVSIVYMTNNPRRIFYQGQGPDSPWVWLVVGVLLMGTAIFALRLRKREAGE